MTAAEWTQVASTGFAALAALAALLTVLRAEADRRDRALPDLFVDAIDDLKRGEVRLTVVNYGGPAREVYVSGVHGPFGFHGLVGPTAYWRPGESRTIVLAMPNLVSEETLTMVTGRDVRMRYLFARTVGGSARRWPLRQAKRLSKGDVFAGFFPDSAGPLDVPNSPVDMEVTERAW